MPNFLSNNNISNNNNTPKVKSSNNTEAPKAIRLKGWLMKQKHGKAKTWLKRYFVLHNDELRYYKTKTDNNTLAVISLDHYSLVSNAEARLSVDKKNKPYTFCLISDDETKYNWPDYFLQAGSDEERQLWVDHIQKHVTQSKSILDKWLERLDLPVESTPALSNNSNVNNSVPHISTEPDHSFRLQNKKNASSTTLPSPPPSKRVRHFSKSLETINTHANRTANYDKELPLSPCDKELPLSPTESFSPIEPLSPTKVISSRLFFWNRSKNLESCESVDCLELNKDLPPMPVVAAPESHIVDPREFENEESYFHVMKGSRSYKTVAC